MDIKVSVNDLKLGMHVAELDRPWADTTFLFQGFILTSESQIEELARQCSYVIVSVERSDPALQLDLAVPGGGGAARRGGDVSKARIKGAQAPGESRGGFLSSLKDVVRNALMGLSSSGDTTQGNDGIRGMQEEPKASEKEKQQHINRMTGLLKSFSTDMEVHYYENAATLADELTTSRSIHNDVCELASDLIRNMSSKDISERLDLAEGLIKDVVDSMIRNSDAMELISRLKNLDEYSYSKAVNVSVRLIAFGRQLGFPKEQLQQLGMGGLLHDIGRTRLPQNHLKNPFKYTAQEYEVEKLHVSEGLVLLSEGGHISQEVIELVERHHERYDGSGYPNGLKGERIGLFGSMAGIVDSYCAMAADHPYVRAMTSASALRAIIDLSGKRYHPGLVDQFVQTIGIYPPGSLVELSSGEVGVVVRQNRLRRLRPTIMVILDPDHQPYPYPHTIDLLYAPMIGDDEVTIRNELGPGAYGINLANYFL
ncbi:MAG TPA: HD-GYP domain-containing protein [Methylophilaceae bacterium]|nr:HD-GYP domain-containing protein [Methylophilaceae bacterium]